MTTYHLYRNGVEVRPGKERMHTSRAAAEGEAAAIARERPGPVYLVERNALGYRLLSTWRSRAVTYHTGNPPQERVHDILPGGTVLDPAS